MTQHEFGERLRAFRKQQKLTQKQLGQRINIANATISSWEDGAKVPNILSIIDLCEAFDLSLDDLLDLTPTRSPSPSKQTNSPDGGTCRRPCAPQSRENPDAD